MKKQIMLALTMCALVARAQDAPQTQQADTNSWVNTTMLKLKTMDFEFSRAQSDIPFLPVLGFVVLALGGGRMGTRTLAVIGAAPTGR